MAQGITNVCTHCAVSIQAWDDGNPYYVDDAGEKQYAYHPVLERDSCIGNDSPHLCLDCGERFKIDSRAPIDRCPRCASENYSRLFKLDGKGCPFCKTGHFQADPDSYLIS